ncbi:unnamed protein product, partial [Symbiodinium necroappetens]
RHLGAAAQVAVSAYPSLLRCGRNYLVGELCILEVLQLIGAICAFQRGTPVADLMWRMRLRSQVTLEHYLQEMTGYSVIPSLPYETRRRIEVANCFFRAVEERAIYYRAARLAASSGVEAAARA